MKIVYIHQYFNTPDMPGGTRSYEMGRRWVADGHDVHVITSSRSPGAQHSSWTRTTEAGITVHWRRVPYSNQMGFLRRLRAFITFAIVAGARARAVRGDVVFATSTPLTVILPALVATAFRSTPIVFEVRDLWPEMPIALGYLRSPVLKFAARRLEMLAYRRSACVVALSEGMADQIVKKGVPSDSIVVAPNACDVDEFSVLRETDEEFRGKRSWLGDRRLVVYLGTIGEINDVAYLVRLAEQVRRGDPDSDIVFAVYGSGKEQAAVQALASRLGVLGENLFMFEDIPKAQVPQVLGTASVALSLFGPIKEMELNSANKFFDALASGTPVAINYGGWQADLIHKEGIGLTLPAGDLVAAAKLLVEFLGSPERLSSAAVAAGRLAREAFSRDDIARDVLMALTSSVNDHSPDVRS